MKNLSWEILECTNLLAKVDTFTSFYKEMEEGEKSVADIATIHKVRQQELKDYLREVFKKRRVAATHVLIVMISDERRMNKPYAMPIQFIPYKSLPDHYIRDLTAVVKKKMEEHKLKVVGKF